VADRLLDASDAPYIVLPSVVKTADATYAARDPTRTLAEVLAERAGMLLGLVEAHQPALVVVDHAPAGLGGELLPVFERLGGRRPRPRFALLLRDVDSGAVALTRRAWESHGIRDLLESLYDAILVFGRRDYFDAVVEYAMSAGAAAKTRFVGYLGEPVDPARAQTVRRRLARDGRPLVVATVGGGEDGYRVLATLAEAHRRWPEDVPFDSVLIAGPLMPASDRRRLAEAIDGVPGVRLIDAVPDLPEYLAAADAVVSMAGFNTVCEVFAAARPAVIVPRTARGSDQALRGALLDRHRLASTLSLDELGPASLLTAIGRLLDGTVRLAPPPSLGGVDGFLAAVDFLLADPTDGPAT
jgi:predicted glycosyltransferase